MKLYMRLCYLLVCVSVVISTSKPNCFLEFFREWNRCSEPSSELGTYFYRTCNSFCQVCLDAISGHCFQYPSICYPHFLRNNRRCRCYAPGRYDRKWWDPTCWL
ncbi:hypothetical protein HELRODRAFT_192130 [Helobdella robusta]|uniref:Uncharacterized protein n=1 Tax=Helobdella robusta TaxID=6412 RepID=T1FTL9_HELRO|nr:hypothetical protein HELRODRAFT_192130 [Helobdella robusta]ESO03190.1 hypothetical protein HELRODRAFT_192130 [Helobdella robusta]